MQRRSDRLNPLHDDEQKHELQGLLRSRHSTHAEEWNDPEPPADDDPVAFRGVTDTPAELAKQFRRTDFPADRDTLVEALRERHAPDLWIDRLEDLPGDRTFDGVHDVLEHLE